MSRALAFFLIFALTSLPASGGGSSGVRIKDITAVQGVRANQLIGYGLVVGLNGTGDSLRNSPFTEQSLQSMLDQMGVNIRSTNARTRNIAAVLITADLPPFAGSGSRIDVTVSSLGDATSLSGGSLVMTPLSGADAAIYAVAQGPVQVSGFGVSGRAESVSQNVPTTGRIPNGALVEREVAGVLDDEGALVLELRNPDFGTAVRITDTINAFATEKYGRQVAREQDLRTVVLQRPLDVGAARFLAEVGELYTEADGPARVVIDERTGTVVIGRDVQIQTVAVSHGSLTVRITEGANVSQPEPFSEGQTVVVPESFVTVNQEGSNLAIMGGTNLETLVRGLNMMGLKPTGIIAILQAIKTSGALQAELVVQ
jgi:flagellar P-ring protein precursor FlgI